MPLNQFPRRSFVGSSTLQTFTGTGSQTVFTLSSTQTQNECFVFVEDVAQVPGVDFTVNGTTLTFTSAPANNAEIVVRGFGVPAPVTTVSDGAVTAAKLATGAIEAKLGYTPVSPTQLTTEVNNLIAGAPGALNTLDELAAALGDDANYAATITNALATKAVPTDITPTNVSDKINSSTGYFDLPSGTTAQRPVSPPVGATRYNTNTGSLEVFDGSAWNSVIRPFVNSISGTIYAGSTSTVTVSGQNFTSTITVRFTRSGTLLAEQTNVSVTSGSASVSVPSGVFTQVSAGDTIAVSVVNSDGTSSVNSVSTTVVGLPTGGTITSAGGFRIHTFTSSANFVVPSNFTASANCLIVAGGGGGGCSTYPNHRGAGGGGAGGYVSENRTFTTGTYSVTVGAGGSGSTSNNDGSNGANSSITGSTTAVGGGKGGDHANGAQYAAGTGGSGGGGTNGFPGVSGTAGQGNSGGAGGPNNDDPYSGGGGGGAGSAGSAGTNASGYNDIGGAGGSGLTWLNGSTYAGGGGGNGSTGGAGGSGGGGNGSSYGSNNATAGTANTGGGGGGRQGSPSPNGGSGIVIIRYQI